MFCGLWSRDLKASLRIAAEKLIHKTSSGVHEGGEEIPFHEFFLLQLLYVMESDRAAE